MAECRRCSGAKKVNGVTADGSLLSVVCPVCEGRGTEYRKDYGPRPSRHFPADDGWKEHDEFMDWLNKENETHDWFRTARQRTIDSPDN